MNKQCLMQTLHLQIRGLQRQLKSSKSGRTVLTLMRLPWLANVANAEALLELAQVQAEGQLRSIELVLEDTVIRAPIDAVILNSSVEEGEVIAPGVTVMTLGNVDRMTITVYLAENQYGKVSVGDLASVTADSFPGEAFEAEVVRIADEAEYTPRNVQTEEERQTTVYALDLRVLDPEGKLKPGMPADVVFALVE